MMWIGAGVLIGRKEQTWEDSKEAGNSRKLLELQSVVIVAVGEKGSQLI